jgi:hypothetical protein
VLTRDADIFIKMTVTGSHTDYPRRALLLYLLS